MSFRQALLLDLILVLGVAVLWNRGSLPAWARVETYRPQPTVVPAFPWGPVSFNPQAYGYRVSLTGKAILLVGDSLLTDCPWAGDVICVPGATTPELAETFEDHVATRRYERILLWSGTYHLAGRHGIESYVRGMTDMVRVARGRADRVVVIGPMPYDPAQLERLIAFRPHEPLREMLEPDTRELARRALAGLRDALPDVPIYDAGAFRAAVTAAHADEELFADGMHLTQRGFARMGAELRTLGYLPAEGGRQAEAAGSGGQGAV